MDHGDFEWDDRKAEANWRKHGVRFESARFVFFDFWGAEQLDESESYGEERSQAIGMVANRLLFVIFTYRQDRRRIISARFTEPYESRQYHEQK